MKEVVLKDFFEGHVSVAELATDAVDALDRRVDSAGTILSRLNAVPMNQEFAVSAEHMVMLVDAVLQTGLSLDALDAICFCLEAASESFMWDPGTPEGERVANSIFWLGTPEINYPLTVGVLTKIRHYLLTGENTLTQADTGVRGKRPRLLTVDELQPKRDV